MNPQPDRLAPGALTHQVLMIMRESGGWLTVRDVHSIIEADRDIAYTTVLTVMQRLVPQGHLEYVRTGRSGSFRTVQNASPEGARSLVDQAVARFGTVAIAQFVERSREDPVLMEELRRQLGIDQ